MLLQGTKGFHQATLEAVADTHNLTGCLHLGGKGTFRGNEFIEGQTGDFYYTVVQCRFKACVGLACDGILNLVQSVA